MNNSDNTEDEAKRVERSLGVYTRYENAPYEEKIIWNKDHSFLTQ